MRVETIFNINIEHGEGPVWDAESNSLYWVNIFAGEFYQGNPIEGTCVNKNIGQPIGALALRASGGIIVAAHEGFGFTTMELNDPVQFFNNPQLDYPLTRFNDGKIDPLGNFIAGTMTFDGKQPIGELYQLNKQQNTYCIEKNLRISNGMDWSPCGNYFYFTDTMQQTIFQYDFNQSNGAISNRKQYINFEKEEYPDGFCIDANGGFWVAIWGGSKILRFSADGKRMGAIDLPVAYPTSCCFGGTDLSTLYITTSRVELSETERKNQPLAGRLLKIETNSKGQLMRKYQG